MTGFERSNALKRATSWSRLMHLCSSEISNTILEASRDKLAKAKLRFFWYAKKSKDFSKLTINRISVPALGPLVGSASGNNGEKMR